MTPVCLFLLFLAFARILHIFNRERDPTWNAIARERGEEIRYRIGRNKGRVTSVSVGLALPGNFRFELRPEGVFDPVARWLRLSHEFQTGDRRFDDRIYIDCDDPALHGALASNPPLRQKIYQLLPIGTGRRLRCVDGWIWMTRPSETLEGGGWKDEQIALAAAQRYQPALHDLRAELAQLRRTLGDPTRGARRLFDGVVVALFVAGIAGCVAQAYRYDHQVVLVEIPRMAGVLTAGVGGLLLAVLLLFLRGISRTHRLLGDLVFAALPAVFVACWGGSIWFNQSFDGYASRALPISAEGARAVRGSKSTHYSLTVPGWPDAHARREIVLRADEYAAMSGRSCVEVLWRSGRLGDAWIDGFRRFDESGNAPC